MSFTLNASLNYCHHVCVTLEQCNGYHDVLCKLNNTVEYTMAVITASAILYSLVITSTWVMTIIGIERFNIKLLCILFIIILYMNV